MGGDGLMVGRQIGKAFGQARNGGRQILDAEAGYILLVEVILLEQSQPLQFGVGLGERQHGGIARRDGLDLGVGKLLGADVLGARAGNLVAPE